MSDALECHPIELASGGELRLAIQETPRTVTLRGVMVPPDAAPAVNRLFERIRREGIAVRCTVAPESRTGAPPASVEYLAWRDKSGDVWQDLAATLVEEGLARVVPGDFPEREDYLARERKAKISGRGLWGERKGGGLI